MRLNTSKIIHFLRWTVNSVQTFRIVYFNQIDLKSSEATLEIANIWIGGMIKEMDLYFEQGYPANLKCANTTLASFKLPPNEKSAADIFCVRPSAGVVILPLIGPSSFGFDYNWVATPVTDVSISLKAQSDL